MFGLGPAVAIVARRRRLLTFTSVLFFSTVFLTAIIADLILPHVVAVTSQPSFPYTGFGTNPLTVFLGILLLNLLFSAFVVVTLPGIVFFPLSVCLLIYRGLVWGLLLHYQSTLNVGFALPTLFLEGFAYVVAASAGVIAGASWLIPEKIYTNEKQNRLQAFGEGFGECLRLYTIVLLLLILADIAETSTITLLVRIL